MKDITELLKGVLEGSILEIIRRSPTYGYDITQQLRNLGLEDVVEGTVYTILVRLERGGFVNVEKKASEIGPPRKFYSLTKSGYDELQLFWDKWEFVSSKVNQLKGMSL